MSRLTSIISRPSKDSQIKQADQSSVSPTFIPVRGLVSIERSFAGRYCIYKEGIALKDLRNTLNSCLEGYVVCSADMSSVCRPEYGPGQRLNSKDVKIRDECIEQQSRPLLLILGIRFTSWVSVLAI